MKGPSPSTPDRDRDRKPGMNTYFSLSGNLFYSQILIDNVSEFQKHHQFFPFKGDYIWIEPTTGNEFDVAIGARVVSAEGRRIAVRDDDGEEHWLSPDRRIKAMHATSINGVEDMIGLGDLHEAGILRNLHIRYNENLIYVCMNSLGYL